MNLVVKPVRILPSGEKMEANQIITDCTQESDAISQAKELSGLSKFNTWHFLIYGKHQNGKVIKDKDYDKQVNNIARKMFSKKS